MLRRFRYLALSLPLLVTGAASATAVVPASEDVVTQTTFVIRGRGWGHGVGMGQWGAYGQAKRGVSYDRILAHYYPGTKITPAAGASVRVLLRDGSGPFAVSSAVPFRVVDGGGVAHDVQPGAVKAGATVKITSPASKPPQVLRGPLTFKPGSEPLQLAGSPYRGNLVVQQVGRRLQVVNAVGVDAYVRGVVSGEVPDDWPLEAVKAQAVAARSYALAQRQEGAILYPDTRSQVYGGVAAESPVGDKAVAGTKRQVLTYDGKVATTFFYASSGGRTADVKDVFAGGKAIPYLVSVPDPDDKWSPYHRWGPVVYTSSRLSKLLGEPGISDVRTVPASGRARQIVLTTRTGEVRLPATDVRRTLDLRSTWLTPGVLSLSRPVGTLQAGAAVSISGVARRVKGPVGLQQRVAGGGWEDGPELDLTDDGTFSTAVWPQKTTWYRLTAADDVVSTALRVPVAGARHLAASRSGAGPSSANGRLSSAFVPDDPLAARQWHLAQIRAFDFWPELPPLAPVTVAVVDTGIDAGHPEFANRIIAARSFVGGAPDDTIGHGTFVAGLIAAAVNNAQGVAGVAFPARLLVAKVSDPDGDIATVDEAKAIRWAVDRGARVINLSLGGLRDPVELPRDTFSRVEADAIAYARSKGVVVVAAVGNSDAAPSSPWPFADWPAALPHVVGVSAVTEHGSVPTFSNRDQVFNDLAAPGQGLLSTLPRKMTAARPSCEEQGYSSCGPPEFRDGSGTSFAAAQVTAAAALLLAVRPDLTPDQVTAVIERSSMDANPGTGCSACATGRDPRTGWGTLDVTSALQALSQPLPPADRYEANDDAGSSAATLYGRSPVAQATVDFWDDQVDVYRVKMRAGARVKVVLRGPAGTQTRLVLWRPGTEHVEGLSREIQSHRLMQSNRPGPNQALSHRTASTGWYYVEVKMTGAGSGAYSLRITKS
jgi:stage II sporulation protein D